MATMLTPQAVRAPIAGLLASPVAPPAADRARATAWTAAVHEDITAMLTALDGGGTFAEERWTRDGGGGGVSRLMVEGATFEKAGVNRSSVHGVLPVEAQQRLEVRPAGAGPVHFFATGVSVVVHPRSPRIPTVHLNVRYFELTDAGGRPLDRWFGGGTDLTPMYPEPADAADYHRALARACDDFGPGLHARLKTWCDDYFVNRHRTQERRGVGGIFYDHLRPDEGGDGMDAGALHALSVAVGRSLRAAYAPIVARRRHEPWSAEERTLQLERRGRYVEFNLLHDRGTLFGLQTSARVDSVLMSLPPHASWPAPGAPAPGSLGARLCAMLVPRDWLAADAVA